MTIPVERTWVVLNTREFLYGLLDSKVTPRVLRTIRDKALSILIGSKNDLFIALKRVIYDI